jgi:putative nucleotidyltransferase with HDIG domain
MNETDKHVELAEIVSLMREISRHDDPEAMRRAYSRRADVLVPVDRTVSLSRRELAFPEYRITRSDLWKEAINPWKEKEKLPRLSGGLLGELLYAGEARIMDEIAVMAGDPAGEYFAGMGSLAAIPHFDNGVALNMVVLMRKEAGAFDRERLPELVLVSGLFGRAMKGLVLASDLRAEQGKLQEQYRAVAELSDTVMEQARALKVHAETLEERVQKRTRQLEVARLDAVYMLAHASEEKDEMTGDHLKRMQHLATELARAMRVEDPEGVGLAAILHDVGKMHVPDAILRKPGPLTAEERKIMEGHTLSGERILADRPFYLPARRVARSHHENWDVSGYPDGLAGEAIPLEARIVHLADVYDALVNVRPYKAAWEKDAARAYIRREAGRMFDPGVAEAFLGGTEFGNWEVRAIPGG